MINLKLNVSGNYGEAGQHKMNGWKRWLEGWNSWKQPCTLDRNFGWFKRLKQKDKFGFFSLGILTQKNGIPNFKISNLKIKILGKKIYTLVFIFHKNIDSNFPRGFGIFWYFKFPRGIPARLWYSLVVFPRFGILWYFKPRGLKIFWHLTSIIIFFCHFW